MAKAKLQNKSHKFIKNLPQVTNPVHDLREGVGLVIDRQIQGAENTMGILDDGYEALSLLDEVVMNDMMNRPEWDQATAGGFTSLATSRIRECFDEIKAMTDKSLDKCYQIASL